MLKSWKSFLSKGIIKHYWLVIRYTHFMQSSLPFLPVYTNTSGTTWCANIPKELENTSIAFQTIECNSKTKQPPSVFKWSESIEWECIGYLHFIHWQKFKQIWKSGLQYSDPSPPKSVSMRSLTLHIKLQMYKTFLILWHGISEEPTMIPQKQITKIIWDRKTLRNLY